MEQSVATGRRHGRPPITTPEQDAEIWERYCAGQGLASIAAAVFGDGSARFEARVRRSVARRSDYVSRDGSMREARGASIRRRRQEKALTLHELATMTGISRTALSCLERGLHRARPSHVSALADALGVAEDELFRPARPHPGYQKAWRGERRTPNRGNAPVVDPAYQEFIETRSRRVVELYTSPEEPSAAEVAAIVGVSKKTVLRDLERAGVARRRVERASKPCDRCGEPIYAKPSRLKRLKYHEDCYRAVQASDAARSAAAKRKRSWWESQPPREPYMVEAECFICNRPVRRKRVTYDITEKERRRTVCADCQPVWTGALLATRRALGSVGDVGQINPLAADSLDGFIRAYSAARKREPELRALVVRPGRRKPFAISLTIEVLHARGFSDGAIAHLIHRARNEAGLEVDGPGKPERERYVTLRRQLDGAYRRPKTA